MSTVTYTADSDNTDAMVAYEDYLETILIDCIAHELEAYMHYCPYCNHDMTDGYSKSRWPFYCSDECEDAANMAAFEDSMAA
jgi:hypothetical protein